MNEKSDIKKYEPKFRDMKFTTEVDLDAWLSKNTFKALYLDDRAGDMQKIWVHETGEILNCDYHSDIYSGKFINIATLQLDQPIEIWDPDSCSWSVFHRLIPVDIIS